MSEFSHSTLGTLGQFFDTHNRVHGNHPKKILHGPPALRLPSPAIYIEGLISVKDFEIETGTHAPYFMLTERESQKRKSSQSTQDPLTAEFILSKRTRSQASGPLPLRSEFGDIPGFSKIKFVFASVSVARDGMVSIEWPNLKDHDNIVTSTCLLQDTAFDQGKTKKVHKIIYDGLPWVAKRFFNVGTGEGDVEITENRDQLVKEASRLSRAAYFLKRFIAEAKRQGVDIEQGINVTEFKLGIEVVPDGSGPSAASEFSLEQYPAAVDAQADPNSDPGIVIWLFEPRRSSKVKHWSGTNEYPSWHQNKLGSTLNAFSHWAYLFSQESTVFSDLQTATAINEYGDGVQVLFDVMTHTLDKSSGVGDHGKTGIDIFLKKHECGNRCSHLRLSCEGFASEGVPADSDAEA
ncbi:Kinase-like protein [Mycena venus]|uniref:Kinase-like protein n=1 Tax=Mycena venus TaxID=2733690 RepID=A0A8H6YTU2_9AGAR|nr:Kinase-like protein [Mycena venus]